MNIHSDIATCPDRMSELALQLRAHVQAIRAAHPSQAVLDETAGIVLVIAALGAESARMRALLSAARSTGQMEHQTVAVESLELHPASAERRGVEEKRSRGDREHELMLESLHRVGDYTLDEEKQSNEENLRASRSGDVNGTGSRSFPGKSEDSLQGSEQKGGLD